MKRSTLLLLFSAAPLWAGSDADWEKIAALDAGPSGEYRSNREIADSAANHLQLQQSTLKKFIADYPEEARRFQAMVRLSAAIVAEGAMKSSTARDNEALGLLTEVESSADASSKDKADAGFARVSYSMQRSPPVAERERLLASVREFRRKYPSDKRFAALLTEVATVFDIEPEKKRSLLNEALAADPGAGTKAKIADDLRRLDFVGRPMRLKAATVDGRAFDVEELRGRPVVILFWAGWSQPSVKQLERLLQAEAELPRGSFTAVAISLDKDKKRVAQVWKQIGARWPLICDEKGWESVLVRTVGINALPTTWILDSEGVLRVLNAREDLRERLREVIGQ